MQRTTAWTGLSAALLASLASCTTDSEATGKILRFTAIPDHNTTELKEKFQPVAAYLSQELGVPVEYVPVTSYESSVESFKNAEVHLAWFGGLTGAQAREAVEGARAIAQGKVDPQYKSYFIVHSSTGIAPSEEFPMELEGRRFTFGDKSSTSGRLMPEHFIRQNTGQAPEAFFAEIHFSGGHDQTAMLVAEGAYEAGAINYKTYDKMVESGAIDPAVCVKVWTTPTYADYNWTAHPAVDELFGEGTIERLQAALVNMKDPDLLAACDRTEGLIEASNEDFAPIRELATELDFLR